MSPPGNSGLRPARVCRYPRPTRDEGGFSLVEALVAVTLFAIGLISVAGLARAVAGQTRSASWQTDQALAGQEVLARIHAGGYAAAINGVVSIGLGGYTYDVTIAVTGVTPGVREVRARVPAVGTLGAHTFTTRLYLPRPLPAGP